MIIDLDPGYKYPSTIVHRFEDLQRFREDHAGEKIVATNGCFDILHAGHVSYLELARELGDILVVGVNDDETVRALKGEGRPINSIEDRVKVLSSIRYIDLVVIFHEISASRFIEAIQPDIYVKGGDYSLDDLPECEQRVLEENVLDIQILPELTGRSTSNIIQRIKA
jgi:rfaE bifunctional protein nucleotidyltransferase chain/domain